jgi:hypothetical protein
MPAQSLSARQQKIPERQKQEKNLERIQQNFISLLLTWADLFQT